jgi:hypothetical protein
VRLWVQSVGRKGGSPKRARTGARSSRIRWRGRGLEGRGGTELREALEGCGREMGRARASRGGGAWRVEAGRAPRSPRSGRVERAGAGKSRACQSLSGLEGEGAGTS